MDAGGPSALTRWPPVCAWTGAVADASAAVPFHLVFI